MARPYGPHEQPWPSWVVLGTDGISAGVCERCGARLERLPSTASNEALVHHFSAFARGHANCPAPVPGAAPDAYTSAAPAPEPAAAPITPVAADAETIVEWDEPDEFIEFEPAQEVGR